MIPVVLSALGAGCVAIFVTLVVERFGGRLGGILGTLPTTIVPASLGVWQVRALTGGYAEAMGSVVVGMVCNAAFLWTWRFGPPHLQALSRGAQGLALTALSLGLWSILAGAWSLGLHGEGGWLDELPGLAVGLTALGVQVGLGLAVTWHEIPAPRARQPVTTRQILVRGGFAASAIGVATWIAAVGHPVLAGMVSVFPAIFLTTMLSLFLAHGEALPAGAVGPMMLGSAAVSVYALLSIGLFPLVGPALGAALSWIGAVLLASLPAAAWLRARAVRSTPIHDSTQNETIK